MRTRSSASRSARDSEALHRLPVCRRAVIGGLLAALAAGTAGAQQNGPERLPVLVASRAAVLERTDAARRLEVSERELTARLQAEVDAVKAELNAEEAELARLRATLPRDEFETRVAAFDQRVRRERRAAQSQAAALQQAFRDARRGLVDALGPILEEVRRMHGALLIVDADSVLAADPAVDVTEEVIGLFDARVPVPIVRIPQPAEVEAGGEEAEAVRPGVDPDPVGGDGGNAATPE